MALSSSRLRTPPSQGGDTGSSPVGATQLRDVGELVDPPDLGSGACNGRVGSSPTISTKKQNFSEIVKKVH